MKEKTKIVSSWKELLQLVENMNNFEYTVVLTGFINKLRGDRTKISKLVFTTKTIDILRENGFKSETERI